MQDIRELDSRGVPGGYVAAEVFEEAAQTQGNRVGFHPDRVFVSHPIQDRTDDEMANLAENAFERICRLVCSSAVK